MCGIYYDWFSVQSLLTAMIDIANDALVANEDKQIIAVGQSVAWASYIQTQILTAQGKDPGQSFTIPFSGSFLIRTSKDDPEKCASYKVNANKPWPSDEMVSGYFNHLASLGASPEQIVAKAKAGQKTVFMDFADKTVGFASFMALYLNEARKQGLLKEVREAVTFLAFLQDEKKAAPAYKLPLPDGTSIITKLESRYLMDYQPDNDKRYSKGIHAMRLASAGNSWQGHMNPRIVPYYPLNEGPEMVLKMPQDNSFFVENTKKAINAAVQQRFGTPNL